MVDSGGKGPHFSASYIFTEVDSRNCQVDIGFLETLEKASFQKPLSREEISLALSGEERCFLIRSNRRDGRGPVVGGCFAMFEEHEIRLTRISVLPEFRGMGYARAMIFLLQKNFASERSLIQCSGGQFLDPVVYYDGFWDYQMDESSRCGLMKMGFHWYGPGRYQLSPTVSAKNRIASNFFLFRPEDFFKF